MPSIEHAYLRKIGQVYYFRIAIPYQHQHNLKAKEFIKSVGTRNRTEAKYIARILAKRFYALFGSGELTQMKAVDIKIYMQKVFREELDWLKAAMMTTPFEIKKDFTYTTKDIEQVWSKDKIGHFAKQHNIPIDTPSNEKVLRQELTKLFDEVLKQGISFSKQLRSFNVDYEKEKQKIQLSNIIPCSPELINQIYRNHYPSSSAPRERFKIRDLFKIYAQEKIRIGDWTGNTPETIEGYLNSCLEIIGDLYIDEFNEGVARNYKENMKRYPKNRHNDQEFRDLTLVEIWQKHEGKRLLSATTMNNQLSKMGSFFDWCSENHYIPTNPLPKVKQKKNKNKEIDKCLPFTDKELKEIFSAPIYTKHKFHHPYYYWLPLLYLYTGARLEELCKLDISDIITYKNIPCIDIIFEEDDLEQSSESTTHKGLKNVQSKRLLPIHPELIELGFLRYIEQRKKCKEAKVFGGLKPIKGKFGNYASTWFNERYKKRFGFKSDHKKVLNSFRHTLKMKMENENFENYTIKSVMGHSSRSSTHGSYGQRNKAVSIEKAMRVISFKEFISEIKPWPV